MDETTIRVLDKSKKGTTHKGFYWIYYDTGKKLALVDYQPGRGGEYPQAMLNDFKGYLQTDGYAGYEQFDSNKNIIMLGCWAHARRKFFEALDYDKQNAEAILARIGGLYQIETHCTENNFTPEQINTIE